MSYVGLVFDFAANIILLSLAGHFIDVKWATGPWGLAIGLILGTLVGFYRLFKFIKKEEKE